MMDEGVSYQITFSEIEEFTRSFTKQIGKGNFGPVYYGIMKDGKEVAVKVMANSSSHVTRQFVTEVALLSRIHHRNLVPLIGYCKEHRNLLVYEYMHNGSLCNHMRDSSKKKPLDWLSRQTPTMQLHSRGVKISSFPFQRLQHHTELESSCHFLSSPFLQICTTP